jgi:hypothetical protein
VVRLASARFGCTVALYVALDGQRPRLSVISAQYFPAVATALRTLQPIEGREAVMFKRDDGQSRTEARAEKDTPKPSRRYADGASGL